MTQTNSTLSLIQEQFPLKLQRQDHFLDFLTIIVQSLYWRAHKKFILITNMVILALTRHFTFIEYNVNFCSERLFNRQFAKYLRKANRNKLHAKKEKR